MRSKRKGRSLGKTHQQIIEAFGGYVATLPSRLGEPLDRAVTKRVEEHVENVLRTLPEALYRDGTPPWEVDGIVLLESHVVAGRDIEGLGFAWIASNQHRAPFRVRILRREEGPTLELRFDSPGGTLPREQLERMWRRGRFPDEDADWNLVYSVPLGFLEGSAG